MAELRDVQLAELSILEEIHRICEQHNIKYALSCGSMLGAVRHKGFIPWDDDLDIYMSFFEFKKFEKVFSSETCFLQSVKTDPNMPFIMYKVRKNNTIMTEDDFIGLDMHQGVWVDIFIYFNAGKNEKTKRIQAKLMTLLQTIRCRGVNKLNDRENIVQKIVDRFPMKMARNVDDFIFFLARAIGSKKSNEYYMTVNNVFEKLFYPKSVIDGQSLYEFEGRQFYGLKNAEGYLTYEYGKNYMTPKKYGSHLSSFDNVIL